MQWLCIFLRLSLILVSGKDELFMLSMQNLIESAEVKDRGEGSAKGGYMRIKLRI
jgi:hypothetical protein